MDAFKTVGKEQTDGPALFPQFDGSLVQLSDPAEALPLLAAVIANMAEALVVADVHGNLVLQNTAFLTLHGYERQEEVPGPGQARANLWEVYDLDGNPLPYEQWPLTLVLGGKGVSNYELKVTHRDTGQTFIGSYSGTPIVDQAGQLHYALLTIRDITSQKQVEANLRHKETQLRRLNQELEERMEQRSQALARSGEALLEARNRFFTLFHSSPVPTVLLALPELTILDANLAYCRYFGLDGQELGGLRAETVAGDGSDASRSEWRRVHQAIEEKGKISNLEIHFKDRSDRTHVALVSAESAILDEQPVAVCTLIDVTERVQAEEQVQLLAAELSLAEVRERRHIAQILHDDLQQMLVALHMRIQIGLRGEAERMQEALRYADEYTGEIIELTRNLSVELSSPSLYNKRLDDGLSWVRDLMAERYGLHVALEVEQGLALTDPDLRGVVIRLVRELLFNTVKHAGVKHASLRATLEEGRLVIRVEDEGTGFDPAILQNQPGGTGYGLMRMGERIRLFGGEFELDSAPGRGTRATILLTPQ